MEKDKLTSTQRIRLAILIICCYLSQKIVVAYVRLIAWQKRTERITS